MTGNSADWSSIKQLKRSIKGEFLWFRDGGKSWIVQDPDTLAKAHAAWAPVNQLGKQMDAYGKEMDKHGKVMDRWARKWSRPPAACRPTCRGCATGAQDERAGPARCPVWASRWASASDKRARPPERQDGGLGRQMNELGEQMRAAHESEGQRRARASMDEVGKRMNEAGKPMDALGKKMDVLGKQMDRESKAADKTMRGLIRDAMAKGLAQQAPARVKAEAYPAN
jgi:hypothetical protein